MVHDKIFNQTNNFIRSDLTPLRKQTNEKNKNIPVFEIHFSFHLKGSNFLIFDYKGMAELHR